MKKLSDSIVNLSAGQYQLTVYDKMTVSQLVLPGTLIEPDSLYIEITNPSNGSPVPKRSR